MAKEKHSKLRSNVSDYDVYFFGKNAHRTSKMQPSCHFRTSHNIRAMHNIILL